MKRRRLADSFSPDTIKKRLAGRQKDQEELNDAFLSFRSLDIYSIVEKKLHIDENQALLLLTSKLTFVGVLNLKMALNHVPATYNAIPRGTSENYLSVSPS